MFLHFCNFGTNLSVRQQFAFQKILLFGYDDERTVVLCTDQLREFEVHFNNIFNPAIFAIELIIIPNYHQSSNRKPNHYALTISINKLTNLLSPSNKIRISLKLFALKSTYHSQKSSLPNSTNPSISISILNAALNKFSKSNSLLTSFINYDISVTSSS